jgi:hypothetical protein
MKIYDRSSLEYLFVTSKYVKNSFWNAQNLPLGLLAAGPVGGLWIGGGLSCVIDIAAAWIKIAPRSDGESLRSLSKATPHGNQRLK